MIDSSKIGIFMLNWKERLIKRFHTLNAIKYGDFTLSSGAKSNYYIDARLVTLDFYGLKAILEGIEFVTEEHKLEYYYIGGPTLGADPIVGGAITTLFDINSGFLIRTKQKDHGTKKLIEGNLPLNSKCLLVEDVITTGNSITTCLDILGDNVKVIGIVSVLDRNSGIKNWTHHGVSIPYFPLLTLKDLDIRNENL